MLHTVRKLNLHVFGFFWKVKIDGTTTPKCILYHLCNKIQLWLTKLTVNILDSKRSEMQNVELFKTKNRLRVNHPQIWIKLNKNGTSKCKLRQKNRNNICCTGVDKRTGRLRCYEGNLSEGHWRYCWKTWRQKSCQNNVKKEIKNDVKKRL